MKMPMLTCNRCGKNDTMMVDAPHLDDPRQYCIECYAILFPPGWTDDELAWNPSASTAGEDTRAYGDEVDGLSDD